MWGTGDGFFPLKWAYWLKDNLQRVEEVVEIEGAPVFWPEQRPEQLNREAARALGPPLLIAAASIRTAPLCARG